MRCSQVEKAELLHKIFDQANTRLSDIVSKINDKQYECLSHFRTIYKKNLGEILQEVQTYDGQALSDNIDSLNHQINVKVEQLQQYLQQTNFKISPEFEIGKTCAEKSILRLRKTKKKTKGLQQESFQCFKCKINHKTTEQLKQHLLSKHHVVLRFKCPYCEYGHFIQNKLTQHMFEEHTIEEKDEEGKKYLTYSCPFTEKKFKSRLPLSDHIKSNENYRTYNTLEKIEIQI